MSKRNNHKPTPEENAKVITKKFANLMIQLLYCTYKEHCFSRETKITWLAKEAVYQLVKNDKNADDTSARNFADKVMDALDVRHTLPQLVYEMGKTHHYTSTVNRLANDFEMYILDIHLMKYCVKHTTDEKNIKILVHNAQVAYYIKHSSKHNWAWITFAILIPFICYFFPYEWIKEIVKGFEYVFGGTGKLVMMSLQNAEHYPIIRLVVTIIAEIPVLCHISHKKNQKFLPLKH